MMTQISSVGSRILFAVAFVFAGVAVWEKLANMMGRTLTFIGDYEPSRLLDLAGIALLFVIAMQLREIKHAGRGKSAG